MANNTEKDIKLEIEYIPLNQLTPYENNARQHGVDDVEKIKNSIVEFDFCDPIGIWGKDNIIVEGHGRLQALKQLGREKAPCIRLDHLTDEQRKAYALAHNQTALLSEWNMEKLQQELDDIDLDMSEFGFDLDVDVDLDEQDTEPDESEFDDIEKLEKHYGVPYQGNKSRIADIIINILPSGKRLVDLFGGGGCYHSLCNVKWQMGCLFV